MNTAGSIEAACLMIDARREFYGIGTGLLFASIDRDPISQIHDLWARGQYPILEPLYYHGDPRTASRLSGVAIRSHMFIASSTRRSTAHIEEC
jgi:hypothetical protein